MSNLFDALIMTTEKDYLRLQNNYHKLADTIPAGKIFFVGNKDVGNLLSKAKLPSQIGYLDEENILSFDEVHAVMSEHMKDLLNGIQLPRGITGWYYQQFLKMQYAKMCQNEYYLVWDGDTIPCKFFSMFNEQSGIPYLDVKHEFHQEYFTTLARLFPGMSKCIEPSFISEHMLINCKIMRQMIADIEGNDKLQGKNFWEKIIHAIEPEQIQESSFSEFETYGTYVCLKFPMAYRLREWHSFRLGGEFFDPDTITEEDYLWLGKDFDAISFEKGHFVRDDHKNLFDNKKYQSKLTAKQMLEIAQQEFKDGYIEIWKDNEFNNKFELENEDEWGEEYIIYENLGEIYLKNNADQAYLCYENAEFLCNDYNEKKRLKEIKNRIREKYEISVQKCAFIILTHNNKYLIQKCLESIRQHCAPGTYSVVVVDNASSDGTSDWLREQNDIILQCNTSNIGFPAGCNSGIKCANAEDDIFLLNDDTRLTHNALFWVRMGLYENDHIGAAGCISNYCGIDQLEDVVFSSIEDYQEYAKKRNVPDKNPYEEKNRLCGFAMLIKRKVLNQVGVLDEELSPGYFEDDDISLRIHKAGYRMMVCHNSFIYHAGSQSFSKRNDLEEIFERNHNYITNKWGYDFLAYSAVTLQEYELLQRITHNRNDSFNIMEIGTGSGNALGKIKYLYPNAKVIGIEKNDKAVDNAIETVPILCLDWQNERLPFLKHSFDYIIYNDRWNEEIDKKDVEQYMEEYLKDTGKLLFVY